MQHKGVRVDPLRGAIESHHIPLAANFLAARQAPIGRGFTRRLGVGYSLLSLMRRGIVMGKAYSHDLRGRVMVAVDTGTGAYAAASFGSGGKLLVIKELLPPILSECDWTILESYQRHRPCRSV